MSGRKKAMQIEPVRVQSLENIAYLGIKGIVAH